MNKQVVFSEPKPYIKPVWGDKEVGVVCDAKINNETYKVKIVRNPITGDLKNVTCLKLPDHTTENTLIHSAVEELCTDELQG